MAQLAEPAGSQRLSTTAIYYIVNSIANIYNVIFWNFHKFKWKIIGRMRIQYLKINHWTVLFANTIWKKNRLPSMDYFWNHIANKTKLLPCLGDPVLDSDADSRQSFDNFLDRVLILEGEHYRSWKRDNKLNKNWFGSRISRFNRISNKTMKWGGFD